MKIPDLYSVNPISFNDIKPWLLKKHYAHRIPSISYSFGLFDLHGVLQAVCSFGLPASPSLIQGVFGGKYKECIIELNRLCACDGLPKNALSFFVSQCLSKLPTPMCVVSYADTSHNHHGYIYQATNWIYTGLSDAHKEYRITGCENLHSRHIFDSDDIKTYSRKDVVKRLEEKYGQGSIQVVERPRKHRYFYFVGDKRQVRDMKKLLIYKQEPNPKGDNVRYDASANIATQMVLF